MPSKPRQHGQRRQSKDHSGYDRMRGSSCARGYDARWQRLRLAFLSAHPLCAHCMRDGVLRQATEVDHIRRISDGGARLDQANLQALCKSCHSRKTATE